MISKRELAAGNMIPVFTSSKLEAVKLQVGNRTGSFTAFIWVESFSVENSLYKEKRRNILVN